MVNLKGENIYGHIMKMLFLLFRKKRGLVILTFHNIKSSELEWFDNTLRFIDNNFEFATIDDIYNKNRESKNIKVLITFDDGFYSNKIIAKKYLSKYKIKAVFFITEKFIGLDSEAAYIFSEKNFFPNSNLSIDQLNEYKAMTWDDVKFLADNGHTIGAHSATHPIISRINNRQKLLEETILSADRIEKIIGKRILLFAFPFGNIDSININTINVIKDRFNYIFSNMRGNLEESLGNYFIFRQNISPLDSQWVIKASIEGRFDWIYRKNRKKLSNILSKIEGMP
jgi:peptidoglycan/xylan/chitin deacetylase (PgdA/CDA1 family)